MFQKDNFSALKLLQNAGVAAPKLLQSDIFSAPKFAANPKLTGPPLKAALVRPSSLCSIYDCGVKPSWEACCQYVCTYRHHRWSNMRSRAHGLVAEFRFLAWLDLIRQIIVPILCDPIDNTVAKGCIRWKAHVCTLVLFLFHVSAWQVVWCTFLNPHQQNYSGAFCWTFDRMWLGHRYPSLLVMRCWAIV